MAVPPVRLGDVRRLSADPDKPQGIAQTGYVHVGLRAEAVTAAGPGLGGLPALLGVRQRCGRHSRCSYCSSGAISLFTCFSW